jgi:AraC-like DNA-binding protein
MSLTGLSKQLTEAPAPDGSLAAAADILSGVLRSIRLSASLQFCFMPTGDWHTDGKAVMAANADGRAAVMPFHILVEGRCWLRLPDRQIDLAAGDIVAFPFGTLHDLGHGAGGRLLDPLAALPPKPWRETPILRYGDSDSGVRMLCGYLQCNAMDFRPLRKALPPMLHVRTASSGEAGWLSATIAQIVSEVDHPRTGGLSMLERLTEIIFIEVLRHQILSAQPGSVGWLAALADPPVARCLALIHDDPKRDWSVQDLAEAAGLSRTTLAERFEAVLATSPMRYVRDWRLYVAGVELRTSGRAIADIGYDAGYGSEAAFNRAFARAYGTPPATWRQLARAELTGTEP